jgi:tetratricopeptide (TPR) repeat protein
MRRKIMITIPLGLRHSLESGSCVLFIGAGIGGHLKDKDNNRAPDAKALAKEMSDKFKINTKIYDLAKISRIVEIRKGRPELISFLSERFFGLEPDDTIKWICSLKWKAIFTTNYDNGIQKAYDSVPNPKQQYVTITSTSEIKQFDPRFEIPIYHLHGSLYGPDKKRIIITKEDYTKFKKDRKGMFNILKTEFLTSNILYIGYSNQDWNWELVLSEVEEEFSPSKMPTSYRIAPETDEFDKEIFEAKNIYSIDTTMDEFVASASAELEIIEQEERLVNKLRQKIPADLLEDFDKNPVAVTRLLSSWEYVNQARFDGAPNSKLFLNGDRPNWALIGSNNYFERDIEDEFYDELLDYATSTKAKAKVKILLAPAGYGITTFIMSLACRLTKARAGSIFMLKPEKQVLDGDIEFAVDSSKERCFFFIDNASDNVGRIRSAIQRLKEAKKSAIFILGERLNEWRQATSLVLGKEFILEPLSDPEIYKLLDYLEKNSALNKLEHLKKRLQFIEIKKRFKKELLVVMREATEDKKFDAILEDEYRGINNETARKAYLIVCCFYLHGVYIRESMLSQLLKINHSELYSKIGKATDGVILSDEIDEGRGIYGARARHRKIAEIVWVRCGLQSDKTIIIQETIDAINLNYSSDSKAFRSFYGSDVFVESIGTLEDKINFFENSCKKDPESPYVRQHFARMLLRERKLDLALAEIDTALEIDKNNTILNHTKGHILSRMAYEAESKDIGIKRLIQAENNFRKTIAIKSRDSYCYQSLAELFLNWAKKSNNESEIAEYIEKAENVINDGLTNCRHRDYLWIVSANIQKFLGDNPKSIEFMERAIADTPGSIRARHILGRAYRKMGNFNESLRVLKYIIENFPDEYRAHVEYALALYSSGATYSESIGILYQSTLYGYNDPRFIATLGGMLFLNGEFSDSEKVFNESRKATFSGSELKSIQFKPLDPVKRNCFLRLEGNVVNKKPQYVWIEVAGYPGSFICPGSKFKNIVMKKGLKLSFRPVFNAKGPIAIGPRVI